MPSSITSLGGSRRTRWSRVLWANSKLWIEGAPPRCRRAAGAAPRRSWDGWRLGHPLGDHTAHLDVVGDVDARERLTGDGLDVEHGFPPLKADGAAGCASCGAGGRHRGAEMAPQESDELGDRDRRAAAEDGGAGRPALDFRGLVLREAPLRGGSAGGQRPHRMQPPRELATRSRRTRPPADPSVPTPRWPGPATCGPSAGPSAGPTSRWRKTVRSRPATPRSAALLRPAAGVAHGCAAPPRRCGEHSARAAAITQAPSRSLPDPAPSGSATAARSPGPGVPRFAAGG